MVGTGSAEELRERKEVSLQERLEERGLQLVLEERGREQDEAFRQRHTNKHGYGVKEDNGLFWGITPTELC